jgi:hypothetical protein
MLQLLFAVSIAQEAVIANAVESTGENVEEESADELLGRESHDFLLIVVAVVPPVELDLPVFDIHDPMIGNRDPVRVAADVVHHLLGSGEGRLGVDDPLRVAHRIEMTAETLRSSKSLEESEEPEFAGVESLLQILQEQSAEQARQHPYGQEETGAARNPPGAIGRDSATRDDTMQVGMMEQILPPSVQHGEKADLRPQAFGISRDGGQGLGRGSEQHAVDEIFVLVRNGRDLFGKREDDMKIVRLENLRFPLCDPFGARQRLALGAMPVAAAVVAGTLVKTAVAPFEMTAEGRRPAHLDRGHDALLCRSERRTIGLSIGSTIAAEDVRHFQLGAIHGAQQLEDGWRCGLDLQGNRVRQQIERARRRAYFAGRDAEIFCGGGQAPMSEEQLNGADVGALLQ